MTEKIGKINMFMKDISPKKITNLPPWEIQKLMENFKEKTRQYEKKERLEKGSILIRALNELGKPLPGQWAEFYNNGAIVGYNSRIKQPEWTLLLPNTKEDFPKGLENNPELGKEYPTWNSSEIGKYFKKRLI